MGFIVGFLVATENDATRAAQDLLRVQPHIDFVMITDPAGKTTRVIRSGEGFRTEETS